jgi:putative transcriptional regulator
MLNENIKTIRKNKGMTQEELASQLHVTRQTISKWEKGLSVPDADMLSRMAEIFDVSVAELLGADRVEQQQMDAVVEQLCRINEQLAIKNRRARKIWKAVIIAAVILIIVPAVITTCSAVLYTVARNSNEFGTGEYTGITTFTYEIDGSENTFVVKYDEKYKVLSCGGEQEEFFAEDFNADRYTNANKLADAFEAYVEENHGQIMEIEVQGFSLEGEY